MLFRDYTPLTNTRNTVTECPQTQSAQTHAYTDIPAGLYLYAVWFITPPLLARNTMFAGLAANLILKDAFLNSRSEILSPLTLSINMWLHAWVSMVSEGAVLQLARSLRRHKAIERQKQTGSRTSGDQHRTQLCFELRARCEKGMNQRRLLAQQATTAARRHFRMCTLSLACII